MVHVGYLSLLFNEGRSCMWLFPVTIASIIIRSAVVKFLKKEHKGKIITLMYAGTLSGFILTVSFFQKVSRFKKPLLSKLAIQQAASSKWILRYKKAADVKHHAAFSYLYTPKQKRIW